MADAVADALGPVTARYQVQLAQIEYYDPAAVEFSGPVQKLAADGPFDALLIPEGGARLRSIAPLLGFYNIDTAKVKLLGSALWTDPNLATEPALVGAWFASPSSAGWMGFSQRYHATYGSDPPRLASIAYDAMTMAMALAKTNDFSDATLSPGRWLHRRRRRVPLRGRRQGAAQSRYRRGAAHGFCAQGSGAEGFLAGPHKLTSETSHLNRPVKPACRPSR